MTLTKLFITFFIFVGMQEVVAEASPEAVVQSTDKNTIWVYAQINVPDKEGIEDYYYYGRINKTIYEQIIDGSRTDGFILFRDLRYWSDGEILKYEDDIDTGDMVFRIEHIMKITIEKKDPYEGE